MAEKGGLADHCWNKDIKVSYGGLGDVYRKIGAPLISS